MLDPTPDTAPTPDRWATEQIARTQTCPICFGPVVRQHTRENHGVMLATYVCDMGHCWGLHWGLAQAIA